MIEQKIYNKMPLFIQNLMITSFGYLWKKRRFGGVFEDNLIEFKNREKFSKEQWTSYQNQELRKVLVNAFLNVPFYREKYQKCGFSINDFENFQMKDLKSLPFLEKEELRQFGKTTMLSEKLTRGGKFFQSSGSTGTPVSIYLSRESHQIWTAGYEVRVKNWAGVSKNMVRGMIGGRRIIPNSRVQYPLYRYNFFEKMVYFSAYHISSETVNNYVEGMHKHKVEFMMGYAMSNYLLAKFIVENQIKAPKLKAVITSSEKLTDEMRETFYKAYGCESYDTWSGVEACAQISECEFHSLHESPDIGIIELIDSVGNLVENGGSGEALCTSLINFDQPLIRYRCGDVLSTLDVSCNCNRGMKTFSEIIGRIEDVVTTIDGRQMVRFHGIFVGLQSVMMGQVVQNSLEDFEINVVCNSTLNEMDAKLIKDRLFSQLGPVNLRISQVDDLVKGANGKFKAVVSKVNK
jgi:phenylacetate-CoA ligase